MDELDREAELDCVEITRTLDVHHVIYSITGRKSSVPAKLHMETILADNKPIHIQNQIRISSSQKRVIFGYTGLSLAMPERVRFKYSLDGFTTGG